VSKLRLLPVGGACKLVWLMLLVRRIPTRQKEWIRTDYLSNQLFASKSG